MGCGGPNPGCSRLPAGPGRRCLQVQEGDLAGVVGHEGEQNQEKVSAEWLAACHIPSGCFTFMACGSIDTWKGL